MEDYLAEIRLFAGNYAPYNWALCWGQILDVNQNPALFSLLGNAYGGDGEFSFGLPDLRGRVAVGANETQINYRHGVKKGTESAVLSLAQMPSHNHTLGCHNGGADESSPMGNVLSTESGMGVQIYSNAGVNDTMHSGSVQAAGANQPVALMQPFLPLNYIICMSGLYPSRS